MAANLFGDDADQISVPALTDQQSLDVSPIMVISEKVESQTQASCEMFIQKEAEETIQSKAMPYESVKYQQIEEVDGAGGQTDNLVMDNDYFAQPVAQESKQEVDLDSMSKIADVLHEKILDGNDIPDLRSILECLQQVADHQQYLPLKLLFILVQNSLEGIAEHRKDSFGLTQLFQEPISKHIDTIVNTLLDKNKTTLEQEIKKEPFKGFPNDR